MKGRIWWVVVATLAVYVAVLYWANPNPQATADVTPGSSRSAEPVGDLAFARLWTRLNLPFQTYADVPALLPTHTSSVFVSVEPQSSQYNREDAKALLSFARAGNKVVWVTSSTDALISALHLSIQKGPPANVTSIKTLLPKSSGTTLSGLKFHATGGLSGTGLKSSAQRYVTPSGTTVGVVMNQGRGEVVIWTVPEVFENQGIGVANNLQIPWQFVGGQSVLWDEYGHGVVAQGMWGTLFGHGGQGTLLLLLAFVVVFLISAFSRFGPVREAADDVPRLDVEFVHALTWHFLRRPLTESREKLLDAAVRRRLCMLYGLQKSSSWEVLDATILPGLPAHLQQAYALWRAQDTQDERVPARSARKKRLAALATLLRLPSEEVSL